MGLERQDYGGFFIRELFLWWTREPELKYRQIEIRGEESVVQMGEVNALET